MGSKFRKPRPFTHTHTHTQCLCWPKLSDAVLNARPNNRDILNVNVNYKHGGRTDTRAGNTSVRENHRRASDKCTGRLSPRSPFTHSLSFSLTLLGFSKHLIKTLFNGKVKKCTKQTPNSGCTRTRAKLGRKWTVLPLSVCVTYLGHVWNTG